MKIGATTIRSGAHRSQHDAQLFTQSHTLRTTQLLGLNSATGWFDLARRARAGAPRLAGTLHLAHAQSNREPGRGKRDFPDAERLVKRLVAQELTLSFVPDTEQRLWRTVMRRKYQITRNRVQLHNRLGIAARRSA